MIPLSVPNLNGNEWKYVKECLDTGWVSSAGSFVGRFERELADYVGAKHAIGTVNGTAALHVALILKDVQPGDLVIMPNLSFIAPANAVRYCGARPVFIDVDPVCWQLDLNLLKHFLQSKCERKDDTLVEQMSGRRIQAILPVHVLGGTGNMRQLKEIAEEFDLPVIEDASEALGSKIFGKSAGTFGQLGCFSFNGNKIMTTGGGGMIVTDDDRLAQRANHLVTTAKTDAIAYRHDEVGYNYRLVNVLAAIGCAQIEQLAGFIEQKRAIAERYRKAFNKMDDIQMQEHHAGANSNEWLFTLLTERADELLQFLLDNGIQCRKLWAPLNQAPMYQNCTYHSSDLVTESIVRRSISLPSSVALSLEEQDQVINTVSRFFNR